MMTDYHSHILPGIDDGAKDETTSLAMIELLKKQGVERIVATPHFYAHRERSVSDFADKRKNAFEAVSGKVSGLDIVLGAEIAIEHGISDMKDIEKLAIQGTDLILTELPYTGFSPWMTSEIYNIHIEYKLKPVIAHIHRYIDYYTENQIEQILELPVILQINNEAFASRKEARFVKKLLKSEIPVIFGSDSHDMTKRRPNWDLLKRKCKSETIENSDNIFEKYRII